jgi:hypothetical protein
MWETEYKEWTEKIEKYNVCDVEVDVVNMNILKNFCLEKKYECGFLYQFKDKFVYVVAKNEELLIQHNIDR